jgi:hypothetical protein
MAANVHVGEIMLDLVSLRSSVSKRLRSMQVGWGRESELDSESEQRADENRLAHSVCFGQPSHSTFPDHVHCLDALQRRPCTLKLSMSLRQPDSLFNRPVVLFHHVEAVHHRETCHNDQIQISTVKRCPSLDLIFLLSINAWLTIRSVAVDLKHHSLCTATTHGSKRWKYKKCSSRT